ncbi:hypothetical protein B0H16DRAFT_1314264 [Mycena metata]|uniref:RNase H type-1 domain-containing protein n=1 Tax=Mycena metata TaxID=1033252 RepID=A0AAD7J579_9AGAR|nr:hypothetical protein B0H16DRAFT_1314264 [Mycena metata]
MKEYLGRQRRLSIDGKTRGHLAVEGEMLGIILGLRIINTFPSVRHATVLVDCQPAIFELLRAKSKYGHLVDRFHAEARAMDLRRLRLAWVPGHEGVEMNELVDGDAKAAALGESGVCRLR